LGPATNFTFYKYV